MRVEDAESFRARGPFPFGILFLEKTRCGTSGEVNIWAAQADAPCLAISHKISCLEEQFQRPRGNFAGCSLLHAPVFGL